MLVAFSHFYTVLKGFRSFITKNLGSVGQRVAKLLAIKVGGLKKKSAASGFYSRSVCKRGRHGLDSAWG